MFLRGGGGEFYPKRSPGQHVDPRSKILIPGDPAFKKGLPVSKKGNPATRNSRFQEGESCNKEFLFSRRGILQQGIPLFKRQVGGLVVGLLDPGISGRFSTHVFLRGSNEGQNPGVGHGVGQIWPDPGSRPFLGSKMGPEKSGFAMKSFCGGSAGEFP